MKQVTGLPEIENEHVDSLVGYLSARYVYGLVLAECAAHVHVEMHGFVCMYVCIHP